MNVLCVSYGSMWWESRRDNGDSAMFNTTGVTRSPASEHLFRLWTFPGLVRFNMAGFGWASRPEHLAGVRCLTSGVESRNGMTRLLCRKPLRRSEPIDFLLACVRSSDVGFIDRSVPWKSKDVRLIAASLHRDGRQEILVLCKPGSWLHSDSGFWRLDVGFNQMHKAELRCRSLGTTAPWSTIQNIAG